MEEIEFMNAISEIVSNRIKHQVQRCTNPRNEHFHTYGERGVRVEYSPSQLQSWFRKSLVDYVKSDIHVGRVNHSKNYSLDNIMLQTKSDNSSERYVRAGNPAVKKKVLIKEYKSNKFVTTTDSVVEAAQYASVTPESVTGVLTGRHISARGFSFEYFTGQTDLKPKKDKMIKKVPVYAICGKFKKMFDSIVEAANYCNVPSSSIHRILKGQRKSAKGYSFEYYKETA